MLACALVAPLLLSQSDVCNELDFAGSTLSVANLGGSKYCCKKEGNKLKCPSRDKSTGEPVRVRSHHSG